MSQNKFKLLKGLSSAKITGHAPLESLKEKARVFMALHNQLVQELWVLKNKIANQWADGDVRSEWVAAAKNIEIVLEKTHSEKQIRKLLEIIRQKEIALFGESKIGGKTPYTL
ncbi:hypothetical protein [Legionella sp. W05-934-2]|jgi:sulfur carrier protein ThiS|uniref:hypothetical protein n=1 Tax=Legionella sp. W05-934-2 TaxID=1198649 RepID=UPI0034637694